jgi:hypothetical protein
VIEKYQEVLSIKKQNRSTIDGFGNSIGYLPNQDPIQITRHDHHNLELKSIIDLGAPEVSGDLDLFLFLPRSLQLASWSKSDLILDFNSRLRLSVAEQVNGGSLTLIKELAQLQRLIDFLDLESETKESRELHLEQIFNTTRQLGAFCGEMLKTRSARHKKNLHMAHFLSNPKADHTSSFDDLCKEVTEVDRSIVMIRKTIDSSLRYKIPVLKLLSQYLTNIYSEYLGSIHEELHHFKNMPTRFSENKFGAGWSALENLLCQNRNKQARQIQEFGITDSCSDELERERYVLKISQLKKFFQSQSFIEVSQKEVIKKVTEPIAAVAAIIAALSVAMLEHAHRSASSTGISIICVGAIMYAVKDRLKDKGRTFFANKVAPRFLPDLSRDLVVEGEKLGVVKDWFAIKKDTTIPAEIKFMREQAYLSEAEKHLREDVLHYRRAFKFKSKSKKMAHSTSSTNDRRGLNEILRINLQRYLKHMDDPYKAVKIFDSEGNFTTLKSHRTYQIYVFVTANLARGGQKYNQLFRVVMDKNGIDRVETEENLF